MKKVLALLIVALMIIPFTACGAPQEIASTAPDTSKEVASEAPAPSSEAPEEQITLTLWCIATESDNYHQPYLSAIADFEAAHTNIKIDFQPFENESYKTKLKSAVSANELPDIFFTWGGGFSQPFVEAGRVLCVDDAYQNYKDALPEVMLTNVTFDGKKYGSIYTMNVSMLFYNKDMFKQYNLNPPTTMDELKTVCQTFIDNGITPFGISAKDKWNLGMAHDGLTLKSAGPAAVTSVLTKDGTATYDAPEFLAATNAFSDLVKMGAYSEDAIALTNDEATQTFYDGKVPMYITGSWMVSDFYTKSKTPEAYGCIPIPVVNSANAKLTDFMGGPSDTLMVAASTKYPEESAMAMFEISQGISKYGYLSGSGIAGWKVDYDAAEVKPLTQEIATLVQGATSLTLWFDTLLQAEDANIYLDNLQQLYLGDITPQQVIDNMVAQLGK